MGSTYHQQYLKQTDFIALSAHQEVIHLQKVLIFILKTLPKGLCLSLPLQQTQLPAMYYTMVSLKQLSFVIRAIFRNTTSA